jgi:hypothetical protein
MKRVLPFIGVLGVYCGLIILNISRASIWFDEAYSKYLLRFNFAEITHYTGDDVHPPFYYYIAKIWTTLFGNQLLTLRLLSATIGFFAIIAFIFLLQIISKHIIKLSYLHKFLLALAFATNPLLIRYAIEARMYIFIILISICSTIALIKVTIGLQFKQYLLFTLITLIGLYTHYYYAIFVIIQLVFYFLVFKKTAFEKPKLKYALICAVICILAYLPWLPYAISRTVSVTHGFWTPKASPKYFFDYFLELFCFIPFDQTSLWQLIIVSLALLITTTIICYNYKSIFDGQNSKFVIFCIIITIFPIIFIDLANNYVPRYIIWAFTFILLLSVIIVPKSWKVSPLLVVILFMQMIFGQPNLYQNLNYNPYTHFMPHANRAVQYILDHSENPKQLYLVAQKWETYYDFAAYENANTNVFTVPEGSNLETMPTEQNFEKLWPSLYPIWDNREKSIIWDIQDTVQKLPELWFIENRQDVFGYIVIHYVNGQEVSREEM